MIILISLLLYIAMLRSLTISTKTQIAISYIGTLTNIDLLNNGL